jgi:hypothetical protein
MEKEPSMFARDQSQSPYIPWNQGKLLGQESPLKLKEIREIRICYHRQQVIRGFSDGKDIFTENIV